MRGGFACRYPFNTYYICPLFPLQLCFPFIIRLYLFYKSKQSILSNTIQYIQQSWRIITNNQTELPFGTSSGHSIKIRTELGSTIQHQPVTHSSVPQAHPHQLELINHHLLHLHTLVPGDNQALALLGQDYLDPDNGEHTQVSAGHMAATAATVLMAAAEVVETVKMMRRAKVRDPAPYLQVVQRARAQKAAPRGEEKDVEEEVVMEEAATEEGDGEVEVAGAHGDDEDHLHLVDLAGSI